MRRTKIMAMGRAGRKQRSSLVTNHIINHVMSDVITNVFRIG